MKERGIIMSSESVLGIIAGLKTQTRRVVLEPPGRPARGSRFGIGDVLWVREALVDDCDLGWRYEADLGCVELDTSSPNYLAGVAWVHHAEKERCPSRHMPKWAARLRLKLVDLRLERVQAVSEADAVAEGMVHGDYFGAKDATGALRAYPTARAAYAAAWDVINGKRDGGVHAWAKNPFVWAITFSRITDTASEKE